MDPKTLELIEDARKDNPELETLVTRHQHLNRQVDELNGQPHLTAEEKIELSRLKKEKLRIRDMIEQIVQKKRSA